MDAKVRRIWPEWEIDAQTPDHGILGSGSFGDVYRIRRCLHGVTEYAALKVITIPRDVRELNQLKQEYETEEQLSSYYSEIKESFEKEYATMVMLRGHANIVYCDDIRFDPHPVDSGWDIHIKMELLSPMIRHLPAKYSEGMAIKLGIHICRALTLCHKMGIIHRDIKPQNVFLSRDGNFKLGDFGIAKHMEGTQLGTMAGTEDYMAPEVNFFQPYSFQADIYSLGLVMYWILNNYTGPFLETNGTKPTYTQKMAARTQRLSGAPLPAPLHGSDALKKVVLKACAFDPQMRYSSALDMLQALLSLESNAGTLLDHEDNGTVVEKRNSSGKASEQPDEVATVFTRDQKGGSSEAAKLIGMLKQQQSRREAEVASSKPQYDTNSCPQAEPYAQRPSRKNAVTETPRKKETSQPYSYIPPKGSTATSVPPKKQQAEPYAYVPPKKTATYVPPKQNTSSSDGGASKSSSAQTPKTTSAATSTKTGAAATPKTSAENKAAPRQRKKKKKTLWAWLVLLFGVAVFAYCVITHPSNQLKETVTTTVGTDSLSLMEVGYIDDPDGKLSVYSYVTDKFPNDSGLTTWYTFTGEKAEHIQFEKIHHLGKGFYKGINDREGINDLSLFTKNGEILLSQDSCLIEWASNQNEDDPRYLLVYKAENKTNNESDYLVSEEDSYISLYHTNGVMYQGTVRVYDTELLRFVPNLPVITDNNKILICGNSVVIKEQDNSYVMYNEEGLPIWETSNDVSVRNGYLVCYGQDARHIYNDQGTCTYTTGLAIYFLSDGSPYLKLSQDLNGENVQTIDIYGNVIFEGLNVTRFYDDMFQVQSEDAFGNYHYGLVNMEGKEILPCKYDYIEEIYKGYCLAKYKDQYTIVNSQGVLATKLNERPYMLLTNKNDHVFVINTRSFDLNAPKGKCSALADGLITIKSDETGLLTVYDLFTGEPLLPYEYERAYYAAGYLYVYREGGWGIFEVHFVRNGSVY